MVDKYRILFFRYIFNQLKLKEVEDYLENNNIEFIDNVKLMCNEEKLCSKYSKYFYLLNDINLTLLDNDEINYLDKINIDTMDKEVSNFLEKTYSRVFLNNTNGKYYGPHEDNYFATGDYIVLGLKYNELGFATGKIKTRKEIENNRTIVLDIIKSIENNNNYKIKIMKYNELFEKLNN